MGKNDKKRLREILKAFINVGFIRIKEKNKPLEDQIAPRQLRLAFEQLGSSFVKIGQILSTRSDLLPDNYIQELTKLQSQVEPLEESVLKETLTTELGQSFDQFFESFNLEPLASASVAQTHRARLKTGEEVVVKIQRPGIKEKIDQDLRLLITLSRKIPKSVIPFVDLGKVFAQLQDTLEKELDFNNEANYLRQFLINNQGIKCIGVPKLFDEFTTPHLLVEEYIEGIAINNFQKLEENGYDLEEIGRKLMLAFIKQVFKDGFFHGDPHPGNLMISDGKIIFIDFGIIGVLDEPLRHSLNDILYSFTTQDVDGMTDAVLSLTTSEETVSRADLSRDIEKILGLYGNVNLGLLSITDLLDDLIKVFQKNNLQSVPQMTVLEKAALQIEGLFRDLAPNTDLSTLAKGYFMESMGMDLLRQSFTKDSFLIELFYVLRNMRVMPRRAHQLLEQVLNGRMLLNLDLNDYSSRIKGIEKAYKQLIFVLLFIGFIFAGAIILASGQAPFIGNTFLSLAVIIALYLLITLIM